MKMQHNDKNLTWFLGELAEADEGQIKTGEIEVYGEGQQGNDCSCTVYITDLAAAAKARIEALELCLRSAQAKFVELEYYTRVQDRGRLTMQCEPNSELNALTRQQGKTVRLIQYHELIGSIQIHFTDGSSIQIFAQEKASQQVTIFEPKS
jgi:hypothetical protein